jgi:biotin synthase
VETTEILNNESATVTPREKWSVELVKQLLEKPFMDLIFLAQSVHRENFNPNKLQLSTLISIKTGGCPEDCSYCPQSVRFNTGVKDDDLMQVSDVLKAASIAKANGASRFCMGAAWRGPKDRDVSKVAEMVSAVKSLGLETCATLGLLKDGQAEVLKDAGLDYYNHNIDTSSEHYEEIISTRTQDDRHDTLKRVKDAGVSVCCGGIIGMGESIDDRADMIAQLANMDPYPQSVPINNLVKVSGTPMENIADIDPFDFVRTIAVARISMPKAMVRLSAGRSEMSDEIQALCFLAGANSVFYGEKLLTTPNATSYGDDELFDRLGLIPSDDVTR